MKIQTTNFGEIEILEENIINFPSGLLAFEDQKDFTIVDNEDEENPFMWLQSLNNPDLAFVIINPFVFKSDYDFNISESTVEKLKIKSQKDLSIYTIVVIPEDIKEMTANLSGPIIINNKERLGKQIIVDNNDYTTKYKLFTDPKGQED